MLPQRASGLVSAVVAVHPSPCRSAGRTTTMGHGPSQPGTGPVPSATKPAGGEAHGKRAGAAQRRRARRRQGGPGQGPDGDGGRGAGVPAGSRGVPLRRDLGWLALSGACLALHFSLWNASLALTTVASSTVLVACSPLFVGVLAGPLLGEPPSRLGWAGIGLTIAGAALIALGDAGAVDLGPRALLGDAMAFGGAAAIGGYFLIGRSLRRRLPASTYAASVYGVAAALLLPASLLSGAPLAGYSGRSWLVIGGVVVGPQLLGHIVFNALLATLTADAVAVIGLTEPVGATLLAWLIFQELPTRWFWPGAVLVLAGVWLGVRGTNRPVDNPKKALDER